MNRTKNEIEHFTKLEHIWWGAKTFAGQKRYDKRFLLFKTLCKPNKESKILEIGCGDGELTRRLVNLKSRIVATDITPEVIKRARNNFKKNKRIVFKVDNAEKLSYGDESFDIVCGMSILHHIKYEKSLKECFRVLKKGGQIFFSEPNLLNPIVFLAIHTPMLRKRMEYSPDEIALETRKVMKSLQKAGFKEIKVYNYDFLHPSTPKVLVNFIDELSSLLEQVPLIKEMSGSMIIWARKT